MKKLVWIIIIPTFVVHLVTGFMVFSNAKVTARHLAEYDLVYPAITQYTFSGYSVFTGLVLGLVSGAAIFFANKSRRSEYLLPVVAMCAWIAVFLHLAVSWLGCTMPLIQIMQ